MDGLATLRGSAEHPQMRVIMFSTLTRKGAMATIEALLQGADDYVAKASNVGQLSESLAALRGELVPKIKQFFVLAEAPAPPKPWVRPAVQAGQVAFRPHIVRKVVAIGVSTGGPTALAEIMPAFPAGFPLPVVMVQHMPPMFTRLLAERLQKQTPLEVVEAGEGTAASPGARVLRSRQVTSTCACGGCGEQRWSRRSTRGRSRTRAGPRSTVPSVRSTKPGREPSIGVVLTGMGQDGLRGVEQLKGPAAPTSSRRTSPPSVVWGMPGADGEGEPRRCRRSARRGRVRDSEAAVKNQCRGKNHPAAGRRVAGRYPPGQLPVPAGLHLQEISGIVIDEGKHYLLEARLLPLVREHKLQSIDDIALRLRADSMPLLRRVVDAMTTNETLFFRTRPSTTRSGRQSCRCSRRNAPPRER